MKEIVRRRCHWVTAADLDFSLRRPGLKTTAFIIGPALRHIVLSFRQNCRSQKQKLFRFALFRHSLDGKAEFKQWQRYNSLTVLFRWPFKHYSLIFEVGLGLLSVRACSPGPSQSQTSIRKHAMVLSIDSGPTHHLALLKLPFV